VDVHVLSSEESGSCGLVGLQGHVYRNGIYLSFLRFQSALMLDEDVVTENPEDANLFFVPLWMCVRTADLLIVATAKD
jgi:hypothetical protein